MAAANIVLGNRDALWIACGIVAAGLVFLLSGARRGALRGTPLLISVLCKTLALTLLAASLLEPQIVTEIPRKGANDVALLADNSSRLAIPATKGAASPSSAMREAFGSATQQKSWLRDLAGSYRTQRFVFDRRLQESPDFAKLDFKGTSTALVSSIDSLFRRYEKRPLAAAVVFTDGNATDEAALQNLIAHPAKAPVFFVASGSDKSPRDLALADVSVTQTPFEDSPVAVTARMEMSGFSGEELALVIRDETGKTVITQKEKPVASASTHTFHARFRPAAKGISFFTATVVRSSAVGLITQPEKLAAAADEATLENNTRTFAVDRKSGPYRVLYVSGRPNWEYKFLHRALESEDEMKLVALIRIAKREPKFQWRGRGGEESNPLFRGFSNQGSEETMRYDQPVLRMIGVADKKELAGGFPSVPEDLLGAYRCIILDDVEQEFFTRAQLDLLERFVSVRGGSLLMLGGAESFRDGGWANTTVARMLPVYLDGAGGAAMEEAHFQLTREGWLEPWMRLRQNEEDETKRQNSMPSFLTVNRVGAVKPGASVLATVSGGENKFVPAWVTQRYGSGRVGVVMVGDLWKWALHDEETHADFDKAWRQLLRHLVVDVPDRAELQTTLENAGAQERMKLQVRVKDRAFKALDDASVVFALQQPDGTKSEVVAEPASGEAGLFEATVASEKAGAYRVKATVKDADGAVIGEPVAGWATNPVADETRSLHNRRALMERIATWSGGRVINLDELSSLPDMLSKLVVPVTESRVEPLWQKWWWLAAVVVLLGIDWTLRRRAGEG